MVYDHESFVFCRVPHGALDTNRNHHPQNPHKVKTTTIITVLCLVFTGGCAHQCAPTIEPVHQCDQTFESVHKGLIELGAMTKNRHYGVVECLDTLEKVDRIHKITARESACYDWTATNADLVEIKQSMVVITMCAVLREN